MEIGSRSVSLAARIILPFIFCGYQIRSLPLRTENNPTCVNNTYNVTFSRVLVTIVAQEIQG